MFIGNAQDALVNSLSVFLDMHWVPLGITMTCCAVAMKSGRSIAIKGLSVRRLFFISGASSRIISVSCACVACAKPGESARRDEPVLDDLSLISCGRRLTSSEIDSS